MDASVALAHPDSVELRKEAVRAHLDTEKLVYAAAVVAAAVGAAFVDILGPKKKWAGYFVVFEANIHQVEEAEFS